MVFDNDKNFLGDMVIVMTVLIMMTIYLTRISWTEDDWSSFKLFLLTPLTLGCNQAGWFDDRGDDVDYDGVCI